MIDKLAKIPTTCPDCGDTTLEKGITRWCLTCMTEIPYTRAEQLAVAERNAKRIEQELWYSDTFAKKITTEREAVNKLYLSTMWLLQQTKEESK